MPENRVAEIVEQLRPGLSWQEHEFEWHPLSPRAGKRMTRIAIVLSLPVAAVAMILIASAWVVERAFDVDIPMSELVKPAVQEVVS